MRDYSIAAKLVASILTGSMLSFSVPPAFAWGMSRCLLNIEKRSLPS